MLPDLMSPATKAVPFSALTDFAPSAEMFTVTTPVFVPVALNPKRYPVP